MELERLLGVIEEKIHNIDLKIDDLDEKVNHLIAFKWQIIGGSVALSFVITLIFQFFKAVGGI